MRQKTRTVHRDFSDVSLEGSFYRVDRQYRGDRVIVRYDPFSVRDKVLIYSQADQFLGTAERYQRDISDDFQPHSLPKPKYNYFELIVEQHDRALDAQAKGIDFTQLTHQRWPFSLLCANRGPITGQQWGNFRLQHRATRNLKAGLRDLARAF